MDLINPYQNKEMSSHVYTPSKKEGKESGEDEDEESELFYYSQEEKVHHNDSSQFSNGKANQSEPDLVNKNKYLPCGESDNDSGLQQPSVHLLDLHDNEESIYQNEEPVSHRSNNENDETN